MTMGELFAGIGGFSLGFRRAGFDVVWQVEIEPYCRKVLEKNFPEAERYNDVREVGKHNLKPVDVICGGFPCQDISIANTGRTGGRGLAGNRSGLWSEGARIIGELRPIWVVLENSEALAIRGLDQVLSDLARLRFDAIWTVIRASALGAKHRRERMFICAHSMRDGLQGRMQNRTFESFAVSALGKLADWPNVSSPFGCRGSDGIPARVERTHAIGNAVVPQIPEWIARRILESEAA